MTKEREVLVLAKIFSFDSDIVNENGLVTWVEQQPDAGEINELVAEVLGF